MKLYLAIDIETESIPFQSRRSTTINLWTSKGRANAALKVAAGKNWRAKWTLLEIDTDHLESIDA